MKVTALPLTAVRVAFPKAQPPEGSLMVETITDAGNFDALREEWKELLAESNASPLFLTWEWLHTWWTHLRGDRELAILCVRRGPELLAIAPFASAGSNLLGAPRLEFLGTGRVGSDYLDLIVREGAEDEVIQALARHLTQLGAVLDLKQVRITTSTSMRLIRQLQGSGCPVRAARTHLCPFIDLRALSFEGYLKGLGSEHRYNFQRKLRKLEAQHALSFECVATEARRLEVLPILFELHRRRWSERGGSDGLSGPGILAFHEDLTRLALERGWLRLFVLWLDGLPAAALYGFRCGSVFSFYQSGFDPSYRKLGVGVVTMGLAIKSAIDEGACEFDLLHGDEAYKFHWTQKRRRLGRLRAFPVGPLGNIAHRASRARDGVKGLLRKFPARVLGAAVGARGGADAAPAR